MYEETWSLECSSFYENSYSTLTENPVYKSLQSMVLINIIDV